MLAASIFHYGEHTVGEAKALLARDGIPVGNDAHDRAVRRHGCQRSGRSRCRAPRRALPREVRIIGGQWKRSKLPVADAPGLRPTPDRVRETLFNWLGQDLDRLALPRRLRRLGRARLRGRVARRRRGRAARARPRARRAACDETQQRLKADAVRIESADALAWMARSAPAAFDLVFIDPPFDADLFAPALAAAARWSRRRASSTSKAGGRSRRTTLAALGLEPAPARPRRRGAFPPAAARADRRAPRYTAAGSTDRGDAP